MSHQTTASILIVEDEVFVRLDLSEAIEAAGYPTRQARCVEEAIHLLESDPTIRAVFTDIVLHGPTDGLTLASEIQERWPATCVVLSSGHIPHNVNEQLPNVKLLPKPYDLRGVRVVLEDMAHWPASLNPVSG
jgi:DNA-binding NtrC family response regulator